MEPRYKEVTLPDEWGVLPLPELVSLADAVLDPLFMAGAGSANR